MIELSQYDPLWPEMFEQEKQKLLSVGQAFLSGSIEHVGSTAVEGMLAKPIIDIMFGVNTLAESVEAIELFEQLGYCYYPYRPESMHWFCKPSPDIRTHHLHLVPYKSELWHERLAFRDALRRDPSISKQYKSLKLELAKKCGHDREQYTQLKGPFIQTILCSLGRA